MKSAGYTQVANPLLYGDGPRRIFPSSSFLRFTMDESALTSAARTLHTLLRDVDSASEPVWNNPALDVAIYRYTEIFLPMLAAFHGRKRAKKVVEITKTAKSSLSSGRAVALNKKIFKDEMDTSEQQQYVAPYDALHGENLTKVFPIPPLDVAFIWAIHRLNPAHYRTHCIRTFGGTQALAGNLEYGTVANAREAKVVTARLQWVVFAEAVGKYEKASRKMFSRKPLSYRNEFEVYLPTYLWPCYYYQGTTKKFDFPPTLKLPSCWKSPVTTYDLHSAARRQRQFLFNVSSPYYESDAALKRGYERYGKFLELMKNHPHRFLVPLYDIDLVWHAHILMDTFKYAADTRRIVGKVVNHTEDDDRTPSGDLEIAFETTSNLWYEEYDEKYVDPKTCYKGNLPDSVNRVYSSGGIMQEDAGVLQELKEKKDCDECDDDEDTRSNVRVCTECVEKYRKSIVLARGGQVRGGACGALFARGMLNDVATKTVSREGAAFGQPISAMVKAKGGGSCGYGGGVANTPYPYMAACGGCGCGGGCGG